MEIRNYTDTRDAFFEELYLLAVADNNVILIHGDQGAETFKKFRQIIPGQIINGGIAEQNLIGVAAGLALGGKKVFVHAIAPFITLRCYEQIKNDLGLMGLPVTLVGIGAGYSYGDAGPTHHAVQDLSILRAIPLALAAKMSGRNFMTVAVLGDGECNEGSVWEAAMFGQGHDLDNLIAVVDDNRIGATDFTRNFSGSVPMEDKWWSFGWQTIRVDGHNFEDMLSAFKKARQSVGQPTAIIAETIKGKGVSFMEDSPIWHHGAPKGELAARAMQELANEDGGENGN